MSETQYISIIGSMLMILVGIVGWIGTRIFNKLDGLADQQAKNHDAIQKQITDGDNILHNRITEIDRRVTRVETRCNMEHPGK